MPPSIDIVVPVYNEASFLPEALPRLAELVSAVPATTWVLIVENGSTDGTAELARRISLDHPVEVLSLPQADYGAAMRAGFLASTADWVVNFDIDYFSGAFLETVLAQGESVDLVIASKRDPASTDRRPPIRRIATRVFNLLLRLLLGSGVTDTHGMKGFRRALVDDIAPKVVSTQDLFDTELVVRAERAGYEIVEVPVEVIEMRRAKSSLVRRVPRTIAGLVRIRRLLAAESAPATR